MSPTSKTTAGVGQRVDVVVVTALTLEFEQALNVDEGAITKWHKESGPYGFEVAIRTYLTRSERPMRVAITRAPQMRSVATTAVAMAFIAKYAPKCLAMCGGCAGDRTQTNLGDVIVGDILFTYDEGALTVETDAQGRPTERFSLDPNHYRLPAQWKQLAETFTERISNAPWLADRPRSLENQGDWLLAELGAENKRPVDHPDRKVRCADWPKVIARLRNRELITPKGLTLTAKGTEYVSELSLQHPDGLPEPASLEVRVGPMATGSDVVRDNTIFRRLGLTRSDGRFC